MPFRLEFLVTFISLFTWFQTLTSSTCHLDQTYDSYQTGDYVVSNSDELHMPFRPVMFFGGAVVYISFKLSRAPHAI